MSQNARDAQFGYDDHFTPARTRKKRKNRMPTEPPSPTVLLDRTSEEVAPTGWLRDTQRILRESLEEAFASSEVAPDVLCLGLGSPSSSRDARAQLAFLLAASDDLGIDRAKVSVYDPVFSDQDLELLAQRSLTPLPDNCEAKHELNTPTIAFLPHCDLKLYENLLRENWSKERLPNVLLIANRLSDYAESIPERKLVAEHPCVARLVPHLTSHTLPPCAPYPTAFNNIAVQFARSVVLAEREPDWWALPPRASPPSAARARESDTILKVPPRMTTATDASGHPKCVSGEDSTSPGTIEDGVAGATAQEAPAGGDAS